MSTAEVRVRKRVRLDEHSNGILMTPEEFDAVNDWDEDFVYELIHGVVRTPLLPGFELLLTPMLQLADDRNPPSPRKKPRGDRH